MDGWAARPGTTGRTGGGQWTILLKRDMNNQHQEFLRKQTVQCRAVKRLLLGLLVLGMLPAFAAEPANKRKAPTVKDQFQELDMDSDAKALHEFGTFLESTQDYAQAALYFERAARQGYAAAQNNLGYCYHRGQGLKRDPAEAFKWYRKAAEQKFAPAQNNLGVLYRDGVGVTRDFAKAAQWFTQAAEQGLAAAQNNLGVCFYRGEGVDKNCAEAVKWYRKSAEQGCTDALINLGVCHVDGCGLPKDYVKGYTCFNAAAARGNPHAAAARDKLKTVMTAREIADGQRRAIHEVANRKRNLTDGDAPPTDPDGDNR